MTHYSTNGEHQRQLRTASVGNADNGTHTNGSFDGLSAFSDWLNPQLVRDIRQWKNNDELFGLYSKLLAHTSPKAFLDTFSEAMVAMHLQRHGLKFRFEVETPNGKHCDFEVEVGNQKLYLHLKRLTPSEYQEPHECTISSRLRYLESIKRPFEVKVRWQDDISETQLQAFVRDASRFLQHGHVGDEYVMRDEAGKELGGMRIAAPSEGPNIHLIVGKPDGFIDESQRIGKLMRRAARQFMPGEVNMVLICGEDDSRVADFEVALLGSHIERWDHFPPQGRRIAHGRDADGFWHEGKYKECKAAGWYTFDPSQNTLQSRLYLREDQELTPNMTSTIVDLFDNPAR